VAEYHGRKGGAVGNMTLYHTTYQVLAEQVCLKNHYVDIIVLTLNIQVLSLASAADKQISPFYKAFYHDSIQEMLTNTK